MLLETRLCVPIRLRIGCYGILLAYNFNLFSLIIVTFFRSLILSKDHFKYMLVYNYAIMTVVS